ncbi:UNC93 protein MFSD11, partial [Trichostrongylus colubriformis]
MQLTPRRHELLSVYLLGFGTLFLYLGYTMQAFIGEAVIHAVSERHPGMISRFAGYYGQAFHYTAFATSSLITPSIQSYIRSKWILTMASLLFAIYYIGFIHVNYIYFYISQALMGVGYSFYNNGEGAYLSEHSSRKTLESNTGIETAVGHSSMFIGGFALALIFYLISSHESSGEAGSQSYTDIQIRLIYGTFLGLNLISVVIFSCLPTKQYDSIASKQTSVPSLKEQFVKFKLCITEVNMLLLIPFFGYMGLIVSFLIGVYPTTLAFTEALRKDVYIVAIYSFGMGAAEIFGGVVLRRLIRRSKEWGLVLTISMHFCAVSTGLVLILLSVPEMATIRPTNAPTLLITP